MRASTNHRLRRPRRCAFRFAAALTTVLLCLPALLDPPDGALHAQLHSAPPTVAGRLIGPDLKPAVGLEVQLIPVPGSYVRRLRELGVADTVPIVDRTRSDAEGRFELAASRAGPHQIEILAAAPDTSPPTIVAPVYTRLLPLAEPTALAPIRLPEMHHLAIGVTDEAGKPVEGAQVVAQATRWSNQERRTADRGLFPPGQTWPPPQRAPAPRPIDPAFGRAATRTDASGLARFRLPTPDANVFVFAAGFELRASVVEDGGSYELRRDPGVTLRVVDSRGTPVSRAVIRVAENIAVPLALTDEHGEATVGLNAGEAIPFQIETANRGFGRTEPIRIPAGDSDRPHVVEVKVSPAVEVAGRAVDAETGLAIEGAAIWLGGRPGDHTWSGPDGTFLLSTRPGVDTLHLSAAAAGYRTEGTEVPLERLRSGSGFSITLMPTARITGIVTDSTGNPVAGASILVDRIDPAQAGPSRRSSGTSYHWRAAYGLDHQARSESDGTFRLAGLDRRLSHLLTVEAPGFVRSSTELPGIGSSAAAPLDIVLNRGRRTWGKVVDTDGRPVEAAGVVLLPVTRSPRGGTVLSYGSDLTATTDVGGVFEFPAVAAGSYQLTVDHSEFASHTPTSIEIPEGEGEIDVGSTTLTPGLQIEGLVVGPDRRPVAGALVSALRPHTAPSPAGEGPRTATTDAGGHFRIGGLPDNPVDVGVQADGYAASHVKAVKPATNDLLEIELNRGAVLAGRVVDTAGDVVAGAMVILFNTGPGPLAGFNRPDQQPVTTDADGRFRVELLSPGSWLASASAHTNAGRAGRTENVPVHLRTGEVREIELILVSHDAQVVGVVTNHLGDAVEQAEVTVIAGRAPGGSSWQSSAGPGGRFRSGPVPAGDATIVASHPEYRQTVREITIDPGTNEVSLVLEPGLEITGTVRSADGQPIPLAAVMAEFDLAPEAMQQFMNDPSNRSRRGSAFQPIETLTDRNGNYRLAGLDAGAYRLKALADGYGSGNAVSQQVRLEASSVARVDIVLPAQATIEVRIAGQPLAGLNVGVQQGVYDYRTATEDPSGNHRIEGLGPGAWTVTAHAIDGRRVQQTVDLLAGDDTVVELRFEEGLHVTGWVTVAGQSPGDGAISLLGRTTQHRWTNLDRQGRFELEDVPPGVYTVSVALPGVTGANAGAIYHRTVEFPEDQNLRLDLESPAVLTGLVLDEEGRPLAGALVGTVEAGTGAAGGAMPRSAVVYTGAFAGTATTDVDGRFELRSAPGSYDLLVASGGFSNQVAHVDLAPAEHRQGLVFELRRATDQQP